MTPDPMGGDITNPQSLNRYAYALNNPATLVDPLGLTAIQYACDVDFCPGAVSFGGGGGNALDYLITGEGFYGGENGDAPDWYPGNFNPDAGYLQNFGSGGSGGGGGTPAPAAKTVAQRLACAAQFGNNHSLAAAAGAQNSFVVNLFLGNTASSLTNLGLFISGNATPTPANFASMVLKGAAQGIPVPPGNPGLSGATGQLRNIGVQAAASAGYNAIAGVGAEPIELGITASGTIATPVAQLSTQTLGSIATGIGVGKFVFDGSTFLYGLVFGCPR